MTQCSEETLREGFKESTSIVTSDRGTMYQDDNQVRSEVLETSEADLYTGNLVSEYSTRE